MLKPGGVVAKHWGLWSPRREFESLPGYFESLDIFRESCQHGFGKHTKLSKTKQVD